MAEMICPKCGKSYGDDLLYCLDDGTALTPVVEEAEIETIANPRFVIDPFKAGDHEYCPSCGTSNRVGSRFCKKCGEPLTDETVEQVEQIIPPSPVYPVYPEAPKRSYAGWIALAVGLVGLFFLIAIIALIAYNRSGGSVVVNANTSPTPTATPKPKTPTPSPTTDQNNINVQTASSIGKTGTLTTDANLRADPDPNSEKVGTQYKGAHVKIIEVAEVPNDEGGTSIWYHVSVTSYGKSIDPNNYGLEKDPDSADEGWINSNPKVYDPSKKTQVHKRTVDFGDNK